MADKSRMLRQHEALRVPQGWIGQAKDFVIQLERIFTDIYQKLHKPTWRGYQIVGYKYEYSNLAAGAALYITGNDFVQNDDVTKHVETPDGYVAAAVRNVLTGDGSVDMAAVRISATGEDWLLKLRNNGSSAKSGTAYLTILYLQTGNPE